MTVGNSWTEYRLDEIADIQGGGTPSRNVTEYFGGSIPWVTPTDLPPIGQIATLGKTRETITEAGLAKSSAKLIPAGAVLFSSRASVGKIALTTRTCATNQGFANFIPNPERVDQSFLAFVLARYTSEIVSLAGKTTFLEVPRGKLRSFRVGVPPLDEQRRIVGRIKECLSRVEEIEALRTATVIEANALLPSMLNSEFEKLGERYPSKAIGSLALETRYGTSSKCSTNPIGNAILRIPNVAGGFVNFKNLKYCNLGERDLERLELQPGDLLFVRTNGSRELVGRCAIFENDADKTYAFASYLIRVRLAKDRMQPHFLSFFLNSTQGRTELDKRRRTSAGQFNINSENLRSIEVPVPPLDVQNEVINKLQGQQNLVIGMQESLTSVTADSSYLRESVLRKAFAGEL